MVLDAVRGFGLADRVILQSFDWRVLGEVAERAPGIPRSYLSNSSHPGAPRNVASPVHGDGSALPEAVWRAGGAVWAPYHGDLTRAGLRSAHALGLSVFAWTANEVADIDRLLELEVDGIITDYPSRVLQRAEQPAAPAPD